MLVKEFSGKSEKEAVSKALEELNLTEDQVRIEVVDKGKRSLLGFGGESPTIIRVYYEESSFAATSCPCRTSRTKGIRQEFYPAVQLVFPDKVMCCGVIGYPVFLGGSRSGKRQQREKHEDEFFVHF